MTGKMDETDSMLDALHFIYLVPCACVCVSTLKAIANNPSFITLRKIEAARAIGQIISRSNNRVFLNTDSLLLNLSDLKVDKAR